ncbi:MAG: enoyl-CoA hydratase/isomerase family protein, partial [Proteobacteria bacterium]|nr:enoyl-CoA hydratase/isomerase family protein [Pseudomonadota bacterium]
MAYENIILEEREPGIYLLTVNRPKVLNALNAATVAEIEAAVGAVGEASGARALVLTGAGERAFVAGADIRELQTVGAFEARAWSAHALRTLR